MSLEKIADNPKLNIYAAKMASDFYYNVDIKSKAIFREMFFFLGTMNDLIKAKTKEKLRYILSRFYAFYTE